MKFRFQFLQKIKNINQVFKFLIIVVSINLSFSLNQDILDNSKTEKNDTIIMLNDSNFEEYKHKIEFLLLFIHATYSDQSEYLKSVFQKIPEHIKTNRTISFGIMTQKNPKTLKKYKIEGPFPKIFLISKDIDKNQDNIILYKGEFDASLILEWVTRKLSTNLKFIQTEQEIFSELDLNQRIVLVVGNTTVIQKFERNSKILQEYPNIKFVGIDKFELIKNFKISDSNLNLNPKLIILKIYDDFINVYIDDIFNFEKVSTFLRTFVYPVATRFTSSDYFHLINKHMTIAVLLVKDYKNDSLKLIEEFKKPAEQYRGNISFLYGKFDDTHQTTLAFEFEIEENDMPICVIFKYSPEEKRWIRYKLNKEFADKSDNVLQFIDDFVNGKSKRFLKSEALPKKGDFLEENVYHLVRNNFDKILLGENINRWVLVLFIRGSCGQCNVVRK